MDSLPPPYAFLAHEGAPRMLVEALKLYGVVETPGPGNTSAILAWADELGARVPTAYARWAARWYDADAIAWCGLFMAVVCRRAGRTPPTKFLAAREWETWGNPAAPAMLGDVLVFSRDGGGHVALYVGEDEARYHCLGGNQGDAVSIKPIAKNRCTAVRRPAYVNQPENVRPVRISALSAAPTSINEA